MKNKQNTTKNPTTTIKHVFYLKENDDMIGVTNSFGLKNGIPYKVLKIEIRVVNIIV